MLPLELPTIQNWSCHNCGGCCRQHAIAVTPEERRRIEMQGWTADPAIGHRPLFVSSGPPWNRGCRLAHQSDGACVFLDEHGLCRIHAKFGEAAKPLACRVYPYAFHPAGRKITLSLRFSCPSVVHNQGRPVITQKPDLRELEELVVPAGAEKMRAPPVCPGQQLDWPDLLVIVQHLEAILALGDLPVAARLLRALAVVDLLGQSKFEKIRGPRLREFLEIITLATATEVPADLLTIHEAGPAGRVQFRLLAAQYARKDTFAECDAGWRRRWSLFRAAVQFAKGRGNVPPLQPGFVPVPFAALEQPFGPRSAEADEMLARYLRVKVQGLHFCGRAFYDVPLVEGFQSLALIFPVVLWIARWLAAGTGRTALAVEDVAQALAIADHHHGYSPAFGQASFRSRVCSLGKMGDIERLIAWYDR